jgi:hypothetical protein
MSFGVKDAGSRSVIAIEANRRDGSVLALAHNNEPDSFRAQTATPALRGTGECFRSHNVANRAMLTARRRIVVPSTSAEAPKLTAKLVLARASATGRLTRSLSKQKPHPSLTAVWGAEDQLDRNETPIGSPVGAFQQRTLTKQSPMEALPRNLI